MNEQILLDYEGLKYEFDEIFDKLKRQNAKMLYAPTVNYDIVGSGPKADATDTLIEQIAKRDKLQHIFDDVSKALRETKQAYEQAIAILEPVEKNYCYHRYILCLSNKQIASSFNCSLVKVYSIRKSMLQKIKDL